MILVWVAAATLALSGCWFALSYNRFVSQRQLIANSWANVETELRRRHDLIPNLVETVRGYASHEASTLAEVVTARQGAVSAAGDTALQARAENALVAGLTHLFAVSEAYPELLANSSFLHLQRQLVTTEDRIQAARRLFNGNVRDYNRRVESVPSRLVAAIFRFRREAYFEVEAALRSGGPPAVSSSRVGAGGDPGSTAAAG